MSAERLLDARNMEPPGPLYAALDAVADLHAGEFLHFRIHREPVMLFGQLLAEGCRYQVFAGAGDDWHVLIWRDRDLVAQAKAAQAYDELRGAQR